MQLTRPLTVLTALAGALALSLAGPAQAATGTLTLGFQQIRNPSGCYDAPFTPLRAANRTNATATVYSEPGCAGPALARLAPGQDGVYEFGASLYIP
ncbi:hypothetical protein [Streptomyces achromogenes]|uniref:hypothetical protein n=1 Tax=Streptomyces achromogenes TaxID=67255 RepID=UPI0036CD741E